MTPTQALTGAVTDLYEAMGRQSLSDRDESYRQSLYYNILARNDTMSRDGYNTAALEFNQLLDRFPASLLRRFTSVSPAPLAPLRGLRKDFAMKKVHLYRLCTLVLALALCVLPLAAAPDVPDPTADFYVGDFANVLSSDLEQYIIEQNQSLSASTGAQIVVVTVDFLDGYDIADYAVTLFNDWGIGSAEENNGYLILLAISDENYYSVPGQGTRRDVFTGGTIDDLQWNYLEEDFAAGDYDAGVRSYFDAVLDVFEEQ